MALTIASVTSCSGAAGPNTATVASIPSGALVVVCSDAAWNIAHTITSPNLSFTNRVNTVVSGSSNIATAIAGSNLTNEVVTATASTSPIGLTVIVFTGAENTYLSNFTTNSGIAPGSSPTVTLTAARANAYVITAWHYGDSPSTWTGNGGTTTLYQLSASSPAYGTGVAARNTTIGTGSTTVSGSFSGSGATWEVSAIEIAESPATVSSDTLTQSDSMACQASGIAGPYYGALATGSDQASYSVAYPTGIQAGNLLFLWCYSIQAVASSWTKPAAFASTYASDFTGNGSYALYYTYATGSESGNVTVTATTGGTSFNAQMARIFCFKRAGNIISGATEQEATSPYANAGVTPTKNGSVVLQFDGVMDNTSGSETDTFQTWANGTNLGSWTGVSAASASATSGRGGAIGLGWATQSTAAATGSIQVALKTGTSPTTGVSITLALTPGSNGVIGDVLDAQDFVGGSIAAQTAGSTSDTLTESDSQAYNKAVSGSTTDTLTESDATLGAKSVAVSITDTFTETDSQSHAAAYAGTVSDSLTESDSQAYNKAVSGVISDSSTESDSIAGVGGATGQISDAFTQSDALTVNIGRAASQSDTLTQSDAVSIAKWLGPQIKSWRYGERTVAEGNQTDIYSFAQTFSTGDHIVVVWSGISFSGAAFPVLSITEVGGGPNTYTKRTELTLGSGYSDSGVYTTTVTTGGYVSVKLSYQANVTSTGQILTLIVEGTNLAVGISGNAGEYAGTGTVAKTLNGVHPNSLIIGSASEYKVGGASLTPYDAKTATIRSVSDGNYTTGGFAAFNTDGSSITVGYYDSSTNWNISAVEIFEDTGSVSDTLTQSDGMSANAYTAVTQGSISDALTVTDSEAGQNNANLHGLPATMPFTMPYYGVERGYSFGDSITMSDAMFLRAPYVSLGDRLTQSDAQSARRGALAAVSDTLTESDATQGQKDGAAGAVADLLTESDSQSANRAAAYSITDTLTQSDSQTVNRAAAHTVSDTLTQSDSQTVNRAAVFDVSDTLTQSDSLTYNKIVSGAISDALTESDATQGQKDGAFGAVSDTLTQSDSFAYNKIVSGAISDTLTESDQILGNKASGASVGDSLTQSDAITRTVGWTASVADTLTQSDSITLAVGWAASVADTLTQSDSAIPLTKGIGVSISDALTVLDALAASVQGAKQGAVSDTLTVTDDLTSNVAKGFAIVDTLTVTDTVAGTSSAKQGAVADTLTQSDYQRAAVYAGTGGSNFFVWNGSAWT